MLNRRKHLVLTVLGVIVLLVVAGIIRKNKATQPQPAGTVQATPEAMNRIANQAGSAENPENLTVPAEYAATYEGLNKELDSFAAYLKTQGQPDKNPGLIYAAELLSANGNQGESLLTDAVYQGNLQMMDRLRELGVQGVKVNINFPLLTSSFPRSADYLGFYKKIAQALRQRNMKILVQMTDVFSDPIVSPLKVDYSGLTTQTYAAEKKQQLQTIIQEIKPDFVTVDTEPGTAAHNTGLTQLTQPAVYGQAVSEMVSGVSHPGIQIGAGIGSWDNIQYLSYLTKLPLDYIDLHVYPLSSRYQNFLQQTVSMSKLIEASGKKVVLDETWLYKTSASEIGGGAGAAANTDIFKRDAYSFWAPLDQKFLGLMAQMANRLRFEFISPFWDKYFFAYLPYNQETAGLSASSVLTISSQAAFANITSGKFTSTGDKYKDIIRSGGF